MKGNSFPNLVDCNVRINGSENDYSAFTSGKENGRRFEGVWSSDSVVDVLNDLSIQHDLRYRLKLTSDSVVKDKLSRWLVDGVLTA
jgi:DICT domain-containing protein